MLFTPIQLPTKSRKYIQFIYNNRLYQFCVLPFGISTAPRVFSNILNPVMVCNCSAPHERHISHHLSGRSTHCCRNLHRLSEPYKQVTFLLESLSFQINYEKSVIIPTQKLGYLGFTINTTSTNFALSIEKFQSIQSLVREHLATEGTI